MSATGIAENIDNVGLALLASPYVAKAVGDRAAKVESLKPVADAAKSYEEAFEAHPEAEVAGLALVSPTVSRRLSGLAQKLPGLKVAEYLRGKHAAYTKLGL